jgi:hypothetical protein
MPAATWNNSGNYVYYSYAMNYAFGAYLVRNFGGFDLYRQMLSNNAANADSVNAALKYCGIKDANGADMTLESARSQFFQPFVFTKSGEGGYTFNKAVSCTKDGVTYTFPAFDISTISRMSVSGVDASGSSPKGALILPANTCADPLSTDCFTLHRGDGWSNITTDKTLNISGGNNISFYLAKVNG